MHVDITLPMGENAIANPRKRPDIVCLKKSSMRVICTDRVDNETGGIMKPDQILIVELKRGGSEIGLMEVAQAEHYKNLDDECLVEKALKEPAQIKMRLEN